MTKFGVLKPCYILQVCVASVHVFLFFGLFACSNKTSTKDDMFAIVESDKFNLHVVVLQRFYQQFQGSFRSTKSHEPSSCQSIARDYHGTH